MKRLKRFLFTLTLATFLIIGFSIPFSYAQGILPSGTSEEYKSCDEVKNEDVIKQALSDKEKFKELMASAKNISITKNAYLRFILGCALKWGKIHLFLIPYYVTFIIEFLLSIAGLIAVLFVVVGGYQYVASGVTEDKEKGKKTIQHALVGFAVALLAWVIVNFIQIALTS